MLTPSKESYDQPRQHIKKQRHYFVNKGPSNQGYDFSSSHVCMWELDYKESWAPKNKCVWTVVLKKTLGLQGDPTRPSQRKSVLNIHWNDWYWSWNSNTLATWWGELTHLKRLWCWERLNARLEGDNRGWDGWMASLTQWTWVWVNSWSWWWIGRLGVLSMVPMGSLSKSWDTTEWLNWTNHELFIYNLLPTAHRRELQECKFIVSLFRLLGISRLPNIPVITQTDTAQV